MGKKLYVGNLPYSTRDEALHDLFSQVGGVESVNVIFDRATGKSKGFAFVEMMTDNDAQAAVERLNGTDFGGRPLTVSEARPQAPREGGGFGGGRGGHGGGGGFRGGRGGGGGGGGFRRDNNRY